MPCPVSRRYQWRSPTGLTLLATAATANDPKDVEVADPPPDSISAISFSPVADFLAVGSWDNNVRICVYTVPENTYIDILPE